MPKSSVRETFDMETRNKYTKVETEIIILVDGKELPSAAVLGDALDKCKELVQETITESYKVPPRVDTPVAEPYKVVKPEQPTQPTQVATPTPAQPVTPSEPAPAEQTVNIPSGW